MILALDISTSALGWSVWNGSDYHWGIQSFTKYNKDYGSLFLSYRQWLEEMIQDNTPEVISMEASYNNMKGASGYLLSSMNAITHMVAFEQDITRYEYAVPTIKKFITGSGRASKEEMIEAIQKRGFEVNDDNEADALGVMFLTQFNLNKEKGE